jgi:hypothetical protein
MDLYFFFFFNVSLPNRKSASQLFEQSPEKQQSIDGIPIKAMVEKKPKFRFEIGFDGVYLVSELSGFLGSDALCESCVYESVRIG